ncbi:LysR family transcriptional regulator [Acidisoma sp. 7E03]
MDTPLSATEYSQLRAFIAVAEARSFSRAADSLGVSASALSQTIRALEERLGVRLLNRTTRSVSLSEAGAHLLRGAEPAIGELGRVIERARRFGERPAGLVRLVAFRKAQEVLRPMLGRFFSQYPEIVLDITFDDAVTDFVAAGFDAAIRLGEVVEADMVAIRLGPDLRQLAVASPAYLARHGTPQTPRDLPQHHCLGWRWDGQARLYNWEFQEAGAWFEVAVSGPLISNSRALLLQAALDGLGIAFVLEQAVIAHVAEGRLVPLLEAWAGSFPGLCLCYPTQRQMAPALRAFIDALRASVTEHSAVLT